MKRAITSLALLICGQLALAQWNTNTAINLEVSSLVVGDMQAIGMDDGKTWSVYYTPASTGGFHLYAQLLDVAGNKMLGQDGVLVDGNPSSSATYVFNLAVDAEGNLIIGTQDKRLGLDSSFVTVGYKIDQSGSSVWNNGAGVELGRGLSPYVTPLSNGNIAFAWTGNNNKIAVQTVSPSGVLSWTNPLVISNSAGSKTTRAQMVPISDGGFVMVYQVYSFGINSKLYAQRYTSAGDSVWTAGAVQLCNESTSAARYYDVKHENDTTYVGYYSSSTLNHFNSYVQRINPDGTLPYGINGAAFSDYTLSSDPGEEGCKIAFNEGEPVIWAIANYQVTSSPINKYGIYVQKFNKSDGQRQFNVNGKEVYAPDTFRYAAQGSLVMKDQYPVFMFASDRSYVIKGTVLDTAGDFLLPQLDVELSSTIFTQPTSLNKGRFALTQNVGSQSVALWAEDRSGSKKIYAQNFLLDMLDTSITVSTVNNVPATIETLNGTLNLGAVVLPSSVNQDVTWSINPVTGDATISATGIVTAVADGTVWAKAVSVAVPGYSDSLLITITNQSSDIDELAEKIGFSAFPVPVDNVLKVKINSAHPALLIEIMDLNGRVISTTNAAANALNTPLSIPVYDVASGTYILKISGKDIVITRKFSKK